MVREGGRGGGADSETGSERIWRVCVCVCVGPLVSGPAGPRRIWARGPPGAAAGTADSASCRLPRTVTLVRLRGVHSIEHETGMRKGKEGLESSELKSVRRVRVVGGGGAKWARGGMSGVNGSGERYL